MGFHVPQPTITHTPAPTATAPARPAQPSLVVDSDTQITATGVAPDDGGSPITSYDWRHRVRGSGGSGWVDRSNVTSLIQAFSGLDASTEYDFRFRATNDVGNSPYSFPVRATTDDAPPVTVDHEVDAGNVSWAFAIPEPTVTHTTPTPTDHAVNAGNVSWSFDVPQPTIRHTSPGPQDHAVDAGKCQLGFYDSPANTITHTRAIAVDHAVDAGNVSWSLPRSPAQGHARRAVCNCPRLPPPRVDWDGDGLFANAHSDVTGALVALPRAVRGRNYGDQIYGRSEAGNLEAVLRNVDGLFARFDSTLALADLVVPGRLVEFAVRRSGQATYRVQWSGLLDDILPLEAQSGRNRVMLTALGPLSLITQTDVSVASYTAISVGNAMPHVLDAAEVPAARRGNINGARVMGRWWSPTQLGIDAARELEETELGFLHETKARRSDSDGCGECPADWQRAHVSIHVHPRRRPGGRRDCADGADRVQRPASWTL